MKRAILLAIPLALALSTRAHAGADTATIETANQEWRALVEPMLPLGERAVAMMPDPQDPQLRQELYRMMFSEMSLAYMALMHADAEHPDFIPIFNMAYNLGGPNPDDTYLLTQLDGKGVYKLSGFKGTVRLTDFQIGGSQFYRGDDKLIPQFANYTLDQVHVKRNGYFEVVLSTERPSGYKGDWWKIDPQATHILVRQIAYDWLNEQDSRLAIERLDRPAIKPRKTAGEIATDMQGISTWVDNWTHFFQRWLQRYEAEGLVNKVVVQDLTAAGGLTTQRYIKGLFDLAPDEALIYETSVPKRCRYWGIQLTERTWSAVDYMNRQSSLNGGTARLDKDRMFRAVISATDPGVPNWLDTGGYAKGSLFGRWTGCDSAPAPVMTKVKLVDVRKYLPADTPSISAEQRDASIRLRRQGAQLRRRW